jgi:hypothetical protein
VNFVGSSHGPTRQVGTLLTRTKRAVLSSSINNIYSTIQQSNRVDRAKKTCHQKYGKIFIPNNNHLAPRTERVSRENRLVMRSLIGGPQSHTVACRQRGERNIFSHVSSVPTHTATHPHPHPHPPSTDGVRSSGSAVDPVAMAMAGAPAPCATIRGHASSGPRPPPPS